MKTKAVGIDAVVDRLHSLEVVLLARLNALEEQLLGRSPAQGIGPPQTIAAALESGPRWTINSYRIAYRTVREFSVTHREFDGTVEAFLASFDLDTTPENFYRAACTVILMPGMAVRSRACRCQTGCWRCRGTGKLTPDDAIRNAAADAFQSLG